MKVGQTDLTGREKVWYAAMNETNFVWMKMFHRLIDPLTKLMRFFEKGSTTIPSVYPILKIFENHMSIVVRDAYGAEYSDVINQFIANYHVRRFKMLDWDLLELAFLLSAPGRE
jgi:hypothetical protein